MKNAFILAAFFAAILSIHAQGPVLVPATVMSVHDGDGFKVKFDDGSTSAIRFTGVDAPEIVGYILKTQPYGRNAGDSLRAFVKGKRVLLDTLTIKGPSQRDVYGRLLADPYLADTTSISLWLCEQGHAWALNIKERRLPNINNILKNAQKEARAADLGLWRSYPTRTGKKARIYTPDWWRNHYSVLSN